MNDFYNPYTLRYKFIRIVPPGIFVKGHRCTGTYKEVVAEFQRYGVPVWFSKLIGGAGIVHIKKEECRVLIEQSGNFQKEALERKNNKSFKEGLRGIEVYEQQQRE